MHTTTADTDFLSFETFDAGGFMDNYYPEFTYHPLTPNRSDSLCNTQHITPPVGPVGFIAKSPAKGGQPFRNTAVIIPAIIIYGTIPTSSSNILFITDKGREDARKEQIIKIQVKSGTFALTSWIPHPP